MKMQSYCKDVNNEEIDWAKRLKRAIKEDISKAEKEIWENQASCWVTCACGNTCSAIERETSHSPEDVYVTGRPVDKELAHLGYNFSEYIHRGLWNLAWIVLCDIEMRAAEILEELQKK